MKFTIIAIALFLTATKSIAAYDYSIEAIIGNANLKESDFSASDAILGVRSGYKVNQYFTLELEYQDYGASKYVLYSMGDVTTTAATKMSALNLGVKSFYQLSNDFSLFGKFGLSSWEYESSVFNNPIFNKGTVLVREDSGNDAYYGFGMLYDFNADVFLTIEYSALKADTSYDTDEISIPALDVVIASYNIESSYEIKSTSISVGVRF